MNEEQEKQANKITRLIMEKFARDMEDKFLEDCGPTPEMVEGASTSAWTSAHTVPTADKIKASILEAKALLERMIPPPSFPFLDSWSIGNKFRDKITHPSLRSIPVPPVPFLPILSFPKIYSNHHFTEQFRFPVSKKRRIRKKWAKRPENFRPSRNVYVMGEHGEGGAFCHPVMAEKIRVGLEGSAEGQI